MRCRGCGTSHGCGASNGLTPADAPHTVAHDTKPARIQPPRSIDTPAQRMFRSRIKGGRTGFGASAPKPRRRSARASSTPSPRYGSEPAEHPTVAEHPTASRQPMLRTPSPTTRNRPRTKLPRSIRRSGAAGCSAERRRSRKSNSQCAPRRGSTGATPNRILRTTSSQRGARRRSDPRGASDGCGASAGLTPADGPHNVSHDTKSAADQTAAEHPTRRSRMFRSRIKGGRTGFGASAPKPPEGSTRAASTPSPRCRSDPRGTSHGCGASNGLTPADAPHTVAHDTKPATDQAAAEHPERHPPAVIEPGNPPAASGCVPAHPVGR